MRQKWMKMSVIIGVMVMLMGCAASQNNFMIKNTVEFNSVTGPLSGHWALVEYLKGDANLLGSRYEKGDVVFDFDRLTATLSLWVREGYIAEKLLDWENQYPGIKVDEYKINLTARWRINDSGEILYFSDQNANIVIKGSGENFEGFYQWERTKFEAGKNIGKDSGLMGLAMGAIAKKVTGTSDLFPPLLGQYNFSFSKDKTRVRIFQTLLGNSTLRLLRIQ